MLFNLLFGVVMDSARPVVDGEPQACKGHGCFRPALLVSFWACAFDAALSHPTNVDVCATMHVKRRMNFFMINTPSSGLECICLSVLVHRQLGSLLLDQQELVPALPLHFAAR